MIELSWYGSNPVQVGLGGAFHSQRLTLRSSQVGAVATDRRARWDHRRRLALALALFADPRLDVLFSRRRPSTSCRRRCPESSAVPALCHLVRYPQA